MAKQTGWRITGSAVGTKDIGLDTFDAWLDKQTTQRSGNTAYNNVAWAYRCVQLRSNALSNLPYVVTRGEQTVDYPLKLNRYFWRIEAALTTSGAAYLLKVRNRVKLLDLQWLNPATMTVNTDPERGITGFTQTIGATRRVFQPEEMVYLRYWSPTDDLGPGVAPMQVIDTEGRLSQHLNAWAAKFFEQGAVPTVLLSTEQILPEPERTRIEDAWKRFAGGIANAWKAVVLQGGLTPQVISQPVKDLVLPELSLLVRQQIAVAFGVPQTMLEDAANYATAESHRRSFYEETVIPEANLIAEGLNAQLFEPYGLTLTFQPQQLDIFQADEAERADSLGKLVAAGMPLKLALEVLGFDLTDEQWAMLDAEAQAKAERAAQMAQQLAGASSETPEPAEDEEDEDEDEEDEAAKSTEVALLQTLVAEYSRAADLLREVVQHAEPAES